MREYSLSLWLLCLLALPIGIALTVYAWSGPIQAPTAGNLFPPITASGVSEVKEAGLSMHGLAVFGDVM